MREIPWNPLGIGKTGGGVVLCDQCGGRIAIDGIRPERMECGEYQVDFFRCVHCGKAYQINTTDERQRELIAERKRLPQKLVAARQGHFRPQTIEGYMNRDRKNRKALERRAGWLRAIGEEILSGKEITTRNGALGDGEADGHSGIEGIQGNRGNHPA